MIKIKLSDEKYEVHFSEDPYGFYALRYGQKWRDLTGDGLILAMVQEIEKLKAANKLFRKDNIEIMDRNENLEKEKIWLLGALKKSKMTTILADYDKWRKK